jgi:hypothetical protein
VHGVAPPDPVHTGFGLLRHRLAAALPARAHTADLVSQRGAALEWGRVRLARHAVLPDRDSMPAQAVRAREVAAGHHVGDEAQERLPLSHLLAGHGVIRPYPLEW